MRFPVEAMRINWMRPAINPFLIRAVRRMSHQLSTRIAERALDTSWYPKLGGMTEAALAKNAKPVFSAFL
jgi:hypothetical protein